MGLGGIDRAQSVKASSMILELLLLLRSRAAPLKTPETISVRYHCAGCTDELLSNATFLSVSVVYVTTRPWMSSDHWGVDSERRAMTARPVNPRPTLLQWFYQAIRVWYRGFGRSDLDVGREVSLMNYIAQPLLWVTWNLFTMNLWSTHWITACKVILCQTPAIRCPIASRSQRTSIEKEIFWCATHDEIFLKRRSLPLHISCSKYRSDLLWLT